MNYTELTNRIEELKSRKGRGSISADETFSLLMELAEKTKAVDINAGSLTVRRLYTSVAAMNADQTPMDQETGKPLKFGQLVCVCNSNDLTLADNGKIYRYNKPGWEFLRQVGDMVQFAKTKEVGNRIEQIETELSSGKNIVYYYKGGYVSKVPGSGIIKADSDLHKYILIPVKGEDEYIYISDRVHDLCAFMTDEYTQLDRFTVVTGENKIIIPDGVNFLAITLEFSLGGDITKKTGDWKKQSVMINTTYVAYTESRFNDVDQSVKSSGYNLSIAAAGETIVYHGGFVNSAGGISRRDPTLYKYLLVPVEQGDIFIYTCDRENSLCALMVDEKKQLFRFTSRAGENTITIPDGVNFLAITLEFSLGGDITKKEGDWRRQAVIKKNITTNPVIDGNEKTSTVIARTKNMFNKYAVIEGYYVNSVNGRLSAFPDCEVSAPIPVEGGARYYLSGRNSVQTEVQFIDTYGNILKPLDPDTGIEKANWALGYQNGVILTPSTAKEIQFTTKFRGNGTNDDIQFEKGSNQTLYAPYFMIRKDFIPDTYGKGEDGHEDIISVETSDKIAFYGCSYTESYYATRNKSWINKLSNLLDLPLANFGVSGNRVIDITTRIRANSNPFGTIGIKELRPSHIAIQNIGNETLHTINKGNLDLYMAEIEEAIENVRSIGAKPILGTDHIVGNVSIDTALGELADNNGILYCPVGTVSERVLQGKYPDFWGAGHPGTRTNASTVYEWFYMLRHIDIRRSVKLFRVRNEYLPYVVDVQSLNYDTLYDRLKKFIEINVGEKALDETNTSWRYYDNLSDTSKYNSVISNNEYCRLITGNTVDFDQWSLVEFIIPKIKPQGIKVVISGTPGLRFFVKNPNIPVIPYSINRNNGMFEVPKETWEGFNEDIGTVFTSTASGSKQITFQGKHMGEQYGGYWLNFSAPSVLSGNAGVLTRVSGGSPVAYTRCHGGLGSYTAGFYGQAHAPKGYFEEIGSICENGIYTIEIHDPNCLQYDKLRLIVNSPGTFSLTNVQCITSGGLDKVLRNNKPEMKCFGNEELLPDTGFGSTVWNNVWNRDEGILFEQISVPYKDYPGFNPYNSHIVLTGSDMGFSNKISRDFHIEASRGYRTLVVKITARLYPKIYNTTIDDAYHTTERQITPTSYDWGHLVVAMNAGGHVPSTHKALVDVGWSEIQFNLIIPPFCDKFLLSIYRDETDFEETSPLSHNFPMQVSDISVSKINGR